MSIADTNKLTSMIKDAPDQVAGLEKSIDSIDASINELDEQRSAINGICTTTEEDARDLIENTILVDKGGDFVQYGSDFGKISYDPEGNLTDWAIKKNTIIPNPTPPPPTITIAVTIYSYTPGDYPDLDEWVEDYDFSNDYITRPLTEGATYGLTPNIDTLGTGKDILEENQEKVYDSVDVLSKYAT